jgi:hypothetical protein
MKLKRKESLLRSQQQFNRNNPWQLEAGGIFVPHLYSNRDANLFSWGDTTGFILNGRRILVSWEHPRTVYANQMNDIIYEQVGEPDFTRFRSGQETPWYKRVLTQLSDLARRLLLGQSKLDVEFSDYVYDRNNWLAEMPHLELSI